MRRSTSSTLRLVAATCALFALLLGGPAAMAAPKPTVAILGLEVIDSGQGIDQASTEFAHGLTDALRQRAKAGTGPYSLAPGSDKELIDQKLLTGCDNEKGDCMAAIGQGLNADQVMYGKVEKRAGGYQVSIKLLSVTQKTVVRTVADVVPYGDAQGAELQRWSKTLYAKLIGDSNQGSLLVKANVERGTVVLDGEPKGNLVAGSARVTGLAEGRYHLVIDSPGYQKYEADVTVTGGQTTSHGATLDASGLKGNSATTGAVGDAQSADRSREGTVSQGGGRGMWKGVLATGLVVAAAAGGAWYYGYTQVDSAEQALCTGRHAGETGCKPVTGLDLGKANDQGNFWSPVTYIGGGVVGVGAALSVFAMYKLNAAERPAVATGRVRRAPIAITPVITPGAAGATLRLDW